MLEVYGYDAEEHAQTAVAKYLNKGREPCHRETGIAKTMEDKYMNWFLPSERQSKL